MSEPIKNASADKVIDFGDESASDKLKRKTKENPFFPVAIVGFSTIVLYGLTGLRKRGSTPLSLYLIQLRVAAQGAAVGTLALGVTYILSKRLYNMYHGIDDFDENSGR
ncbi:HIG1 domain family member 1A, mitochondrial [Halotydeus destructor]|nr:HIG1 domain family member 1A, mitochondrial [Halotydeus destructor]